MREDFVEMQHGSRQCQSIKPKGRENYDRLKTARSFAFCAALFATLLLSGCGRHEVHRDALFKGNINEMSSNSINTYQKTGSGPEVLVKSETWNPDRVINIRGGEVKWNASFVTFNPEGGEQPLTKEFLDVMNPLWTDYPSDLTDRAKLLVSVREGLRAVFKKASADEFKTGIQINIALIDCLLTDSEAAMTDWEALPPGLPYRSPPPGTTKPTLDEMCFFVKNSFMLNSLKTRSGDLLGKPRWAKYEKRIKPAAGPHFKLKGDETLLFNGIAFTLNLETVDKNGEFFIAPFVTVENKTTNTILFGPPSFLFTVGGNRVEAFNPANMKVGIAMPGADINEPVLKIDNHSRITLTGDSRYAAFYPLKIEVSNFSQVERVCFAPWYIGSYWKNQKMILEMKTPMPSKGEENTWAWGITGDNVFKWELDVISASPAIEEFDAENSIQEWETYIRGIDKVKK